MDTLTVEKKAFVCVCVLEGVLFFPLQNVKSVKLHFSRGLLQSFAKGELS